MRNIADIMELFLMSSGVAYWIGVLVGIKKIIDKEGDK